MFNVVEGDVSGGGGGVAEDGLVGAWSEVAVVVGGWG